MTSKCEIAETAIRGHLIARLEGEGLISPRRARQLAKADLDAVLDIVFLHCKRVLVPFADTTLVITPKGTVQ